MKIWKYELKLVDRQAVSMPIGATILSVANQRGNLCLWAKVNPRHNHPTNRIIQIVETGNPIPNEEMTFIGTVVIDPFVWHVFECVS